MHEKLPMAALHSMPDEPPSRKRGEVGIPALLILLGALLAYGGGLVRTSTETTSTPFAALGLSMRFLACVNMTSVGGASFG